jgi:hypothetical protein
MDPLNSNGFFGGETGAVMVDWYPVEASMTESWLILS